MTVEMRGGAVSDSAYEKKRDFEATPEPRPGKKNARDGAPIFVIQEHDASSRHWDLRLQIDGALVSWAVPKGPSTDPSDKRLAVRTEDHPLEYADFEGVIPEGEYGGGTVIVWDRGEYRNLRADKDDGRDGDGTDMKEALHEGQLEVWLDGEKIRGGYALVHAKLGGDERAWLLVKMKDDEADARRNPTSTEPRSVLSGRTVEQVAEAEREKEAG